MKYYNHPHLTDGDAEAQRGQVTPSGPPREQTQAQAAWLQSLLFIKETFELVSQALPSGFS